MRQKLLRDLVKAQLDELVTNQHIKPPIPDLWYYGYACGACWALGLNEDSVEILQTYLDQIATQRKREK